MKRSTGTSRTIGRIGSLLGLVGLLSFLLGIFGAPRVLAIAGVAMMVASFTAFFIEEVGNRRASAAGGEFSSD
jgi:hypothetical protein